MGAYPVKGVATDANKMAALATMHNDYMAYSYIWMVMCFMIEQGLTAGGFVPKVPESAKQQSAPGFPPYAAGAWPFGPYPGAGSNLEKKKTPRQEIGQGCTFPPQSERSLGQRHGG